MNIHFDEGMMAAMAKAMDMDDDMWAEVFVTSLAVFNEAADTE